MKKPFMSLKQARDIYFNARTNAGIIVGYIMHWDKTLTVEDNAKNLNLSYQGAYQFAKAYGMEYLKGAKTVRLSDHLRVWDENLTLAENAKVIGRSQRWAKIFATKYVLKHKERKAGRPKNV